MSGPSTSKAPQVLNEEEMKNFDETRFAKLPNEMQTFIIEKMKNAERLNLLTAYPVILDNLEHSWVEDEKLKKAINAGDKLYSNCKDVYITYKPYIFYCAKCFEDNFAQMFSGTRLPEPKLFGVKHERLCIEGFDVFNEPATVLRDALQKTGTTTRCLSINSDAVNFDIASHFVKAVSPDEQLKISHNTNESAQFKQLAAVAESYAELFKVKKLELSGPLLTDKDSLIRYFALFPPFLSIRNTEFPDGKTFLQESHAADFLKHLTTKVWLEGSPEAAALDSLNNWTFQLQYSTIPVIEGEGEEETVTPTGGEANPFTLEQLLEINDDDLTVHSDDFYKHISFPLNISIGDRQVVIHVHEEINYFDRQRAMQLVKDPGAFEEAIDSENPLSDVSGGDILYDSDVEYEISYPSENDYDDYDSYDEW